MMTDEEEKNQKDEGSYQNILIPEERQLCQSPAMSTSNII